VVALRSSAASRNVCKIFRRERHHYQGCRNGQRFRCGLRIVTARRVCCSFEFRSSRFVKFPRLPVFRFLLLTERLDASGSSPALFSAKTLENRLSQAPCKVLSALGNGPQGLALWPRAFSGGITKTSSGHPPSGRRPCDPSIGHRRFHPSVPCPWFGSRYSLVSASDSGGSPQ
jgi:hypothetical protein